MQGSKLQAFCSEAHPLASCLQLFLSNIEVEDIVEVPISELYVYAISIIFLSLSQNIRFDYRRKSHSEYRPSMQPYPCAVVICIETLCSRDLLLVFCSKIQVHLGFQFSALNSHTKICPLCLVWGGLKKR